jgi:hypothetical protein
MKKISFLLCLCLFALPSLAQNSNLNQASIKKIGKIALKKKDVKIFDAYIQKEGGDSIPTALLGSISYWRMIILGKTYRKTVKTEVNATAIQKMQKEILSEGEKAVASYSMDYKEKTRIDRLNVWKKVKFVEPSVYQAEENELKAMGYRPDKLGTSVSTFYTFNSIRHFVGVSLSPLTSINKSYAIKNQKGETLYRNQGTYTVEFLPLSAAYDWQNKTTEVTAGFFQWNGPTGINFTKIGWQNTRHINANKNKNYFFYRPEFTLGYANFSASIGRNIYFSKNDTYTSSNKTVATLKYTAVLNNKR